MPEGLPRRQQTGQTLQKYFVPLAAGIQVVYNSSGLQYYRHADWLGSSRFGGTPAGGVQYSLAYAPFGETTNESGTVDRSYTGQTQDTVPGSTGLYDFLFRQHASSQGRWLVPDPAGLAAVDLTNPQTWNRYAYVANNPLSNVDPLGLDCVYDNGDGTVSGQAGDCKSSTDDGYYVDCNGCLFNDRGGLNTPVLDSATGSLYFTDSNGNGIAGTTIAGFADPMGLTQFATVSDTGTFSVSPASSGTTCPAAEFTITGVGPKQAPSTTGISLTPRAQIPLGGVAIKLDNFRTGSLAGNKWRPVVGGIQLIPSWLSVQIPPGIPTLGPYFPVDTISANGVVSTGPGNQIDVYGYTSQSQAFASTRTVSVTAFIPANNIGVRCPE